MITHHPCLCPTGNEICVIKRLVPQKANYNYIQLVLEAITNIYGFSSHNYHLQQVVFWIVSVSMADFSRNSQFCFWRTFWENETKGKLSDSLEAHLKYAFLSRLFFLTNTFLFL